MFTPETIQLMVDRYKILPPDIQQKLFSDDLLRSIKVIAEKYRLGWKGYLLENEIALVLLGFEPIALFAENVQHELELPVNDAVGIANDIDDLIFKQIRVSLLSIQPKQDGIGSEPEEHEQAPLSEEQRLEQSSSFAAQRLSTPTETKTELEQVQDKSSSLRIDSYRELPK